MTNPTWQLIPRTGIARGNLEVSLGEERAELRRRMADDFLPLAETNFADEDDFVSKDESVLIRVRYGGTQARDIEFLRGALEYQGIQLHAGTTLSELTQKFSEKNLSIEPTSWLGDGSDCPELNVAIATHEDVGGEGDGIEWVILSTNFE